MTDTATEPTYGSAIAEIARRLRVVEFGTGALAALRRHDPQAVLRQSAFHRLVAAFPDRWFQADGARIRWATLVHAMAIGAKAGDSPPDGDAGEAFARAGLSEARFTRLLAARDAAFRDQLVLVARFMHAHDIGFSWRRLGRLVLDEGRREDSADRLRFELARGYYRALNERSRKTPADAPQAA